MESEDGIAVKIKEAYFDNVTGNKQHHRHYLRACYMHTAFIENEDFVRRVANLLTEDELHYLLTSLVDYGSMELIGINEAWLADMGLMRRPQRSVIEKHSKRRFIKKFQLISGLIVYGGNVDLLKEYVRLPRGLDLMQTDDQRNSILHYIVDISIHQPGNAVKALQVIADALEVNKMKKLVSMKNDKQKTALDVASELCLPEIMLAIMNIDNVYKFSIGNCGSYHHVCYDLSEFYERKRSNVLTPLHHISVASEHELQRMNDCDFLRREPFASWVKEICLENKAVTRVWMLFQYLLVLSYLSVLFYMKDIGIHSHSMTIPNGIIAGIGFVLSLQEIIGFFQNLMYTKLFVMKFFQRRYPIALVRGYRVMQELFVLSVTLVHAILAATDDSDPILTKYVIPYLLLSNVICGVIGLIFFTMLNNTLGHLLVVVERTAAALFAFLLLAFFYFVAFSLSLHLLHVGPQRSNTTDHKPFATIPSSAYETIMLSIGVIAPVEWYFDSSESSLMAVTIYVGLLVYNTLILINLMIAIMNERMVELCRYKESIVTVGQLAIYTITSNRRTKFGANKGLILRSEDGSKHFLYTMQPVINH